MFTGIIEETGKIASAGRSGAGFCVTVRARKVLEGTRVGDSIAVNGACLTVTHLDADTFSADVSGETLDKTAIGVWRTGTAVNLERAATLSTRLGGHLVQGHVDGLAKIESVRSEGAGAVVRIACPAALRKYIADKGSVAIDGVSLTVCAPDSSGFSVAVIPATLAATTFGSKRAGDAVHIECDIVAKHIESLLAYGGSPWTA